MCRDLQALVALRGFYCFHREKGDIWCIVEVLGECGLCAFLCALWSQRTKWNAKTERKERERGRVMRGHTVNVKHLAHAALYLQAGKIQSCVCEYNRVLAFQSSDVCTQTLKLQKASWKHRPNSSHIDCVHAVRSLQNAILKMSRYDKKADKSPNICIRMLKCLFNVAKSGEVLDHSFWGLKAFSTFCPGNHLWPFMRLSTALKCSLNWWQTRAVEAKFRCDGK